MIATCYYTLSLQWRFTQNRMFSLNTNNGYGTLHVWCDVIIFWVLIRYMYTLFFFLFCYQKLRMHVHDYNSYQHDTF